MKSILLLLTSLLVSTTLLATGRLDSIRAGEYDKRTVCVTGVVTGVLKDGIGPEYRYLSLRSDEGSVGISFTVNVLSDTECRRLIDATVEVKGVASRFETWRNGYQSHVSIHRNEELHVLEPPPAMNAAASQPVTASGIHRQCVTGKVLLRGRRRIFITPRYRSVMEILASDEQGDLPPIGSTVTAFGFLDRGTFGQRLTETLLRIEPIPEATAPKPVDAAPLLVPHTLPERIPAEGNCTKIIRLKGMVVAGPDDGLPTSAGFTVQRDGTTVFVDISDLGDAARTITPGSTVEVTGLCLYAFETASQSPIPQFKRITLIPATSNDIRVLSGPPWWTPARLLIVMVALLAALVGIIIWNASLRVFAERRGRELLRAQVEGLTARLKVDERTRLAVELHDSLSQTLSCVAMEVETARLSDDEGRLRQHLGTADKMLSSCRNEVRNCLWDLRSDVLGEHDMNAVLRKTLQPHVRNVKLSINFDVPRHLFSDNTAHEIAKVVRELTVNAILHGRATAIDIRSERTDGMLRIVVLDNGCGFDPATAPGVPQGHFGLEGVRERLRKLSGTFEIASSAAGGMAATITLPLPKQDKRMHPHLS